MPDLLTVLVTEIRRINAADGDLHELVVRDVQTGTNGSLIVTAAEGRKLLGDCPTSDLVEVDRSAIVWRD